MTAAPDQMAPRAMDPAAMAAARQAMMPQRWQCAVCVSSRRSWELARQDIIMAAVEQAKAAGVPSPLQFLPPDLVAEIPPVSEAVTMATVPSHGPAAVCLAHAPVIADGTRQPLLVATAGLNLAQFAAGR